MAAEIRVHIINKENLKEHNVISIPTSSLNPLQTGHVGVHTVLIGLISANIS